AAGRLDFQDVLIIPVGARHYSQALEMAARVRSAASQVFRELGESTLLADEGGLSPNRRQTREALELVIRAIERAGLVVGGDIALALDVAASQLWQGLYALPVDN